jgi:hypothetical protein
MILEEDTSRYNGNEVLNDAARRGDLAAVQRMIVDQLEWDRWQATIQAWNSGQTAVIDALLEAGVGEVGRNSLLKMTVSGGALKWTEQLLREGTSKKARGFALNGLAEWQRYTRSRPAELVDRHHKCLLAVLAAGVDAGDRRRARDKARAYGDELVASWLDGRRKTPTQQQGLP